MTILKRYKCIKSNDEKRFAVGEIYPLYKGDRNYIVANNNVKWYEKEFPIIEQEYGVEFDEVKEKIPSSELDLNKLTLEELEEYINIMHSYNYAEIELNNFIKRVTK